MLVWWRHVLHEIYSQIYSACSLQWTAIRHIYQYHLAVHLATYLHNTSSQEMDNWFSILTKCRFSLEHKAQNVSISGDSEQHNKKHHERGF